MVHFNTYFFVSNWAVCFIFLFHLFIGFDKIVEILIEKRANLYAVNDDNNTALIIAAMHGKTLICLKNGLPL